MRVVPIAGAQKVKAGACRGIKAEDFAAVMGVRARQARQLPCLAAADVVDGGRAGHRFAIGKCAECVKACRAKGLGHAAAGGGGIHGDDRGRAAGGEIAKRDVVGAQDFRRVKASKQVLQPVRWQVRRFKQAGGNVDPCDPQSPGAAFRHDTGQQILPSRLQQFIFRQGTRCHQSHDLATQGAFCRGASLAWGLCLFGDRHAKSPADQPRKIGGGSMYRHAAHRDGHARMRAARRQGDVERRRRRLGIGEEQFIKIAHPEEEQGFGMLRLQGEPLRHGGGGAFGGGDGHVMDV